MRASAALHGPAASTTASAPISPRQPAPSPATGPRPACASRTRDAAAPRAIARAIARGSHWRSPGTQVAPRSRRAGRARARAPAPGSSSSHSTPAARSRSIRAGSAARPASVAVDDERALAADPRALAVARLDLVVGGAAEHRQLELRPAVLVRAQDVALAEARSCRPTPRRASSSSTSAPRRASARGGRRADDAGADHAPPSTSSEKPAGNGSLGSSRYWPIPVIHARPVISGITAGRPPTSVSPTSRPVKRVPITDSWTKSVVERELAAGVQLRHPRARAGPARRAVEPAGVDRDGGAGVGAVAARGGEDHVAQPGDALVGGVDRAVLVLDRGHHARARLDQLGRARGVDLDAAEAASTIA